MILLQFSMAENQKIVVELKCFTLLNYIEWQFNKKKNLIPSVQCIYCPCGLRSENIYRLGLCENHNIKCIEQFEKDIYVGACSFEYLLIQIKDFASKYQSQISAQLIAEFIAGDEAELIVKKECIVTKDQQFQLPLCSSLMDNAQEIICNGIDTDTEGFRNWKFECKLPPNTRTASPYPSASGGELQMTIDDDISDLYE